MLYVGKNLTRKNGMEALDKSRIHKRKLKKIFCIWHKWCHLDTEPLGGFSAFILPKVILLTLTQKLIVEAYFSLGEVYTFLYSALKELWLGSEHK